jgi:alpha-galactosidase
MTLWCIARSPLMFGGDLPSLDPATLALITNRQVINVDQHSRNNQQVLGRGDIRAWVADSGVYRGHYVAVFNTGETEQTAELNWSDLGLGSGPISAQDVWGKEPLERRKNLKVRLRPHASALFRIPLTYKDKVQAAL